MGCYCVWCCLRCCCVVLLLLPSRPLLLQQLMPSNAHCMSAGIKKAVAEHKPKIVFLTSPNNPDGSMLSTEELLEVLELPVLVSQPSGIGWAELAVLQCWLQGEAEVPEPPVLVRLLNLLAVAV